MAGESNISLGDIAARAEKLEAEKPAEEVVAAEAVKEGEEAHKVEPAAEKKAEATAEPVKKAPNDPEELRKWNTKVSMELSDVKKRLEQLTEVLNKTTKKQIDWKDLAKDPAKLTAAIEAERAQAVKEAVEPYEKRVNESVADYTRSEKERRKHDPAYPRWGELMPKMMDMAMKADSRVNFDQHPSKALDELYELAQKDAPAAAPVASTPSVKTYSEADLATAREEARKEALAEAQKNLKNEEAGAGVGGMGKGAPKGKAGGIDKAAAWKMPMSDLKAALQQASEK